MKAVIDVHDVYKKFWLYKTKPVLLKSLLRLDKKEVFWALRKVSFQVRKGEMLGIVGKNGSGKSTLLKILAGISLPTLGAVAVSGRLVSLLELGAGFHYELTGRENIFLNGAIMGMARGDIENNFDSIVDFAGLREFIETPVKNYSSGMFLRLGFAVAIHLNPEILLIDEVLAVGDWEFQKKCLRKISELKQKGVTIVFVSHALDQVREFCDRVILLENGEIRGEGSPAEILEKFCTGGA